MQLFALEDGFPLSAAKAEKKKNYQCPECFSIVRLRSGPHRQLHFYHLGSSKQCRQHAKSEEHVQLQLQLSQGIQGGRMECLFPTVHRIADVAWPEKKMIVEIQCSPITWEEVDARNRDYQSLGYQVIWILHDKRYNKRIMSAVEHHLRSANACYFTNVNRMGKGVIYDQFEILNNDRRLFRGPPLVVNLSQTFAPFSLCLDCALPQVLHDRVSKWKCVVLGDLLYRVVHDSDREQVVKQMLKVEKLYLEPSFKRLPLLSLLTKSYQNLCRLFLKKIST